MAISRPTVFDLPYRLRAVKVFLNWSGEQSRQFALALYEWLPQAVQAPKPYTFREGK
jgi:hypothetical protein